MTADESLGMTWWNGLSRFERSTLLHQAETTLKRHPSAADCWAFWRAGKISMGGAS